ncbi:MAG: lytic transglycosylase domain-containing protein [Sarcina sp.]
MKIKGLGLEQIAAMAMVVQAKKSSKDKDSPAFGIMMESVLASAAANRSEVAKDDVTLEKNEGKVDLEVLKPVKPEVSVTDGNTESKSDMERINSAIKVASKKYGVQEGLIRAIIKTESNFNANVISHAGAQGVMQIMPANFKMLGITDGHNIEQNINGGVKLLRQYLDKFDGDVQMALMAYNGGPGTMQRRGVKSPSDLYKMPKETQNYVPKVLGFYNKGI